MLQGGCFLLLNYPVSCRVSPAEDPGGGELFCERLRLCLLRIREAEQPEGHHAQGRFYLRDQKCGRPRLLWLALSRARPRLPLRSEARPAPPSLGSSVRNAAGPASSG